MKKSEMELPTVFSQIAKHAIKDEDDGDNSSDKE
jgi:hypothetical protein